MIRITNQEDFIRGTGLFKPRVYRIVQNKENNETLKGVTPLTELTYELVPEDELYSTNCSSASEPHCIHCSYLYDNRVNSPVIREQGPQTQEDSSWGIKRLIKEISSVLKMCVLHIFSLQMFLLRMVFKYYFERK
ncbi:hypothetical protein TNCV_2938031 [Trichonephila clavipes]|nr:hypothetical protein TNCV_2938031 [Trichonephila clavipes]